MLLWCRAGHGFSGTQECQLLRNMASPGYAETTFALPLLSPSMESGRCVLSAGCLALSPEERRDAEERIVLSLVAEFLCFLLPPSSSSLETIAPNGPGTGHLLLLLRLFFNTSSVYSPCFCKEEELQWISFCFEGRWRGGSVFSLSGKALSGTLHVEEIWEQRAVRDVCVDSAHLRQRLLPWPKQYDTFEC